MGLFGAFPCFEQIGVFQGFKFKRQHWPFELKTDFLTESNYCTVCFWSTKCWTLCWILQWGMVFRMVESGSVSYTVPECIAMRPHKARYMSLLSSNCQHKLHGTRFGWKHGLYQIGCIYFSVTDGPFSSNFFQGIGNVSKRGPKKEIPDSRGPTFAHFGFRVFLLKESNCHNVVNIRS